MTPTDAGAVVLVYWVVGGVLLAAGIYLLLGWVAEWLLRGRRG